MAKFVVNETKLINDNVFKYEEKLNSPLNRFLDKSPSFVTYFHINNEETTADQGFLDTEALLGDKSSLRFNQINNMPIYGLEQVQIQLAEEDQGIDGSYEGEAVMIPGTVKPLPNDFFVINHLRQYFLFRLQRINFFQVHCRNYPKRTSHLYNKPLRCIHL